MTFLHLTDHPDFTLDPDAPVLGWGPKNHAPCEIMTGVLYVSPADTDRWQECSWTNRRPFIVTIALSEGAVEGVDYLTLSDTETLIVNLDAATVQSVERREQS